MTREFRDDPNVESEVWQFAFARAAIFSFLLLVATLSTSRLCGLSTHLWARSIAAGPILRDVQRSALICLMLSAPPTLWQSSLAYQRIDYHRILMILGITLCVLGAILSLRIVAEEIARHSTLASASAYIPALDLAGGLLLPIASGFTLIMFPDIDQKRMACGLKLLAACCLLAVIGIKFASQIPMVHAVPGGTTETPQHRQISYAPVTA